MKHFALPAAALCLPLLAAPAQAEDIMSILARKAEMPVRLAPKTIDYSYTLTVDIKAREGKDLSEGKAVFRIDPTQPAGSRANIISISDADSEALQDCGFCRIHRSYLINLEYVAKYNKGKGGFITLSSGQELEVSASRKNDFLEAFGVR